MTANERTGLLAVFVHMPAQKGMQAASCPVTPAYGRRGMNPGKPHIDYERHARVWKVERLEMNDENGITMDNDIKNDSDIKFISTGIFTAEELTAMLELRQEREEKERQEHERLQAESILPKVEEPEPQREPDSDAEQGKKRRLLFYGFIFGILVFLFGFVMMLQTLLDYHRSRKIYNDTEQEFLVVNQDVVEEVAVAENVRDDEHTELPPAEDEEPEKKNWYDMITVDMDALIAQNPDIIGWIWFENGEISYPLLQGEDNDKYLHMAYDGAKVMAGSIFMDYENSPDLTDSHTLIYGHNMKDRTMFGSLRSYWKAGYYEEHKYFQIITPQQSYRYEIFAYEDVPEDSFIYQIPFGETDEFEEFIRQIRKLSVIKRGDLEVTKEDKVITLSTCSSTGRRFVFHCVLIDAH